MKPSRRTVGAAFAIFAGAAPVAYGAARHAEGPPPGHTGGFGDPTCQACHAEFDLNVAGTLTIEGVPERYEAGASYVLSVVLRSTEMAASGFQLAARFADGEGAGKQAGLLRPIDGAVRIAPDSTSDVVYAQQAPGSATARDPELVTWTLEWVAPAGAAAVAFHAAANSANGDNSPLGDLVYTAEARSTGPEGGALPPERAPGSSSSGPPKSRGPG